MHIPIRTGLCRPKPRISITTTDCSQKYSIEEKTDQSLKWCWRTKWRQNGAAASLAVSDNQEFLSTLNYMNHMKPEFFLSAAIQSVTSGLVWWGFVWFLKKEVKPAWNFPAVHWKQEDYRDTTKLVLLVSPAPADKLPKESIPGGLFKFALGRLTVFCFIISAFAS